MDTSNAWVFVSHSNKDYEKITYIRNKLEALHYRPLLFYLKCLEEDAEIFELIKREINARDRFILCQSKNTDQSVWVQKEIEYIKSLNRPYEIIDIEGTDEEIDRSIELFDAKSTAIVWSTDYTIAQSVAKSFVSKSFQVELLPEATVGNFPRDFFEKHAFFSTGNVEVLEDNFTHNYCIGKGNLVLIISRELTSSERFNLDIIATRIHHLGKRINKVRFYIVNDKGIQLNRDFFYELYNGEGMHARFVIGKSEEETSKLIVNDIINDDSSLMNR